MSAPFDHLDQITDWLKATDIQVFELCGREGGVRLSRRVDGTFERADLAAGFKPHRAEGTLLPSPGVGIFLNAHPLQSAPPVRIGATVRQGQVLGFLRIGMMLVPVASTGEGILSEVLAADGALVGYGTPLFRLGEA